MFHNGTILLGNLANRCSLGLVGKGSILKFACEHLGVRYLRSNDEDVVKYFLKTILTLPHTALSFTTYGANRKKFRGFRARIKTLFFNFIELQCFDMGVHLKFN